MSEQQTYPLAHTSTDVVLSPGSLRSRKTQTVSSFLCRTNKRLMFSLITLIDPSPADNYYTHHVWRTYQSFDRLFRPVDLRKYVASENTAEVTILDRFAFFAAMYYEGVRYESLLERLAGTRNLVLMTSDLHSWAIFPELIDPSMLDLPRLDPSLNRYERLLEMFDKLNIRHLITNYDCPELRIIRMQRRSLCTHVIDLHIDPSSFRDYGLRKKYDLIIYGVHMPSAYPFRHRVCQLMLRSRRFKVLHLDVGDCLYNSAICGEGLARKINQSWLGLSTVSNFDYLVGKYFEIPACRSVVLGNMNEQGRAIFGDHYVHIDDGMMDCQILDVVAEALADRCRLQGYADRLYHVIHTKYTLEENERKLFEVARHVLESSRG